MLNTLRRSKLLNIQERIKNESSLVFDITSHPVFPKLRFILSEMHLLPAPGREYGEVFKKVTIIGFRRAKV